VKRLIKLIVVVLIANALWRIGAAYVSFYRFKDSVRFAATDLRKSEDELRSSILELASTYDVPLAEDAIAIHREAQHTLVEGSYKTPIAVLPGYEYKWPFSVDIDAYAPVPPGTANDAAKP
jgi:hypothetical protein